MARTVAAIQAQIITSWQAQPELAAANSTSQTAKWRLITFIVAVAIAIFEQILDVFKVEIEGIAAAGVPGTPLWVQQKVYEFQYSATVPQVIALVDFVPTYTTVDESLRIVTRASVVTNTNNTVQVKVAKGTTPGPLSGAEETALDSYLDEIMFAGIQWAIVNDAADKVSVEGTIYYNGQYSSVIEANVIAALTAYLVGLPFNGVVKVSEINDAIQAVAGVNDVNITMVKARRDSVAYASAYEVYNLSAGTNTLQWATYAGYAVEETTATHTFADTLVFVPQN